MYWEFRLPLPCMTLIYVHDTVLTLANPIPEANNLGMEYTPIQGANITQETLWSHSVIHQTATNEKLTMKFKSWNLTLEILQDFTLVCSFFTSYYNKIKLIRDLTVENADSATRNRNISITGYCSLVWHQRSRFQHGTWGTPTTHVKWW